MKKEDLLGGIMGFVVGDALGVPVEFSDRAIRREDPVVDMRGYGTHNQPKGTWSDDSSLTFCLMETLSKSYDLDDLGERFVRCFHNGYWTPYGLLFDIGMSTQSAIKRLEVGVDPIEAGGEGEDDNGNGSLMRILPLAFYLKDAPIEERIEKLREVSSLTHGHPRAILGSAIYLEYVLNLLAGEDIRGAYEKTKEIIKESYNIEPYVKEISHYRRILAADIDRLPEAKIESTGYVVHTLESLLWVLLRSNSYQDAVLKAVNLGGDTDTIAALAGGLAGIYYGYNEIPKSWLDNIVKRDEILDLIDRFWKAL